MTNAPEPMPPLTPEQYHRAVQLCSQVVDAARSDDGGPTVAGSFLGQLAELLDPVDEKGRGPSYRRGYADGRLAERAGLAWGEQCSRVEKYYVGGFDEPPFAPKLADAPIVTGESGAPAPLVVDHPVHESTLPTELQPPRIVTKQCRGCGSWLSGEVAVGEPLWCKACGKANHT